MDRHARLAATAVVLVTLLRLIYGATTGLAFDEAYYWCWSRHLDIWYYDQGPWIAWSLRATTALLGDTLLGVRIGAALYAAGGAAFLFMAARRLAGPRVALGTVLLLLAAPLPAAGGVLSTYDGPQVFFWCAALWTLLRALDGKIGAWYLTGLLCLAGTLAKVTMVFFPVGVLLLLAWHPEHRRWLRTPHPYVAGAIAFLAFGALFAWDRSHEHLYTLHTATLGKRHTGAAPGRWLGDFLAGQLGALGPALFVAEVVALGRLARAPAFGLDDRARRLIVCFAAPMLLVCVVNALRSKLEINWPISAHMAGMIAVAAWWSVLWSRGRRGAVAAMVAPSVLLQAVALFPGAHAAIGLTLPAKIGSKLNETYGWEQIAAAVDQERRRLGAPDNSVFVAATNYKATAILSFVAPGQKEAVCLFPGTRRNQFYLWSRPDRLVGHDAVLVFDDDPKELLATMAPWFASIGDPVVVEVRRAGYHGPLKRWTIVPARDFRGYDPEASAIGF